MQAYLFDYIQQQKGFVAIKVGCGLVHHQNGRPSPGFAQDGDGTLLNSAEFHRRAIQHLSQLGKAVLLQLFCDPLAPLQGSLLLALTRHFNQRIQRIGAHQACMLLHQTGLVCCTQRLAFALNLPPAAKARVDVIEASQSTQQSGLACTSRPKQCSDTRGWQRKIHLGQDDARAIRRPQAPCLQTVLLIQESLPRTP